MEECSPNVCHPPTGEEFVFGCGVCISVMGCRADYRSMGHGSIDQMGHLSWMGQWVMGQNHWPTHPLINFND